MTTTKPTNKRLETIQFIRDNSTCLMQLFYNKRNKTSYELRSKIGGHTFVLITYNEGESGFEVYYPDQKNNTDEVKFNFEEYGK